MSHIISSTRLSTYQKHHNKTISSKQNSFKFINSRQIQKYCQQQETKQQTQDEIAALRTEGQKQQMQSQDLDEEGASGSVLAGSALVLGVTAFFLSRLGAGGPSLAALEQESIQIDAALANGKPTVVEFYANWCEVCQQMAPDTKFVRDKYSDQVNFVMLNVENSKWAGEVAEYKVKGIPEYVFLDKSGQPQAAAVGRLPMEVLEGDTRALAENIKMPYASVVKESSPLQNPAAQGQKLSNPRDHS
eukprot:TRINITY_DN9518_c0_g3_i1.p1 TRINITY_DN9518_c0_g3~~TRINITY_DN9518_c0_g3_i1.p1  ORF type:complete len:272 (-),score=37.58 TRINITY_DN9518_c0_g3_i1:315-1052(-)